MYVSLSIPADESDDERFVNLVAQFVAGFAQLHYSAEIQVYKVDHWFDHKWLGFSGKKLGALGHWATHLTIPPFVANRIVAVEHFVRGQSDSAWATSNKPDVHYRGPSEGNLHRQAKIIAPNTALFWYSGDTAATGRGSLMAYVPIQQEYWQWFLAFAREDAWRILRRKGIYEYEVRMLEAAGVGEEVSHRRRLNT